MQDVAKKDSLATRRSSSAREGLPRIGFLGVGWLGRRRLQALCEARAAEIVALSDPSAECLDECKEWVPQAERCETFDELLNVSLDAIVISTPSALHAEQSIAALERGVAVFCQKPLGRNTEEVRAIVGTARRADRLLGVDLSYRHIAGLQKMRELIRAGALGNIFAVDLVFHNAFGPQSPWFYDARLSGGGCVVDLGIHLVDAALWVLDSAVVGVSSRVLAQGHPLAVKPEAVEDFATARLDLANGAVVTLACSWRLHAGRDAVIEASFYGTAGGVALRNVDGSFHDFRAERYTGTKTELLAQPPDPWGGRAAVAFARQLAVDKRFDAEVERQIEVALALDAIYGRENAASLVAMGAAR
jgi:predicted dehydrogenase